MSLYTPIPAHPMSSRRVRSLARFFALKYAREKGLPVRHLSDEAERLVVQYEWQDDLGVLNSTIRNAVTMAEGAEIDAAAVRLPEVLGSRDEAKEWAQVEEATRVLMGQTLADVERELILLTLECCLGNRSLAADVLGISVRTLRNKLAKFAHEGMPVTDPPTPSGRSRHSIRHGHHTSFHTP